MKTLTILIACLLVLNGCATALFPSPDSETILRKYEVPITMEANNITLPLEYYNGKVPVICFQCVVIYVTAEVPKSFRLQVPLVSKQP